MKKTIMLAVILVIAISAFSQKRTDKGVFKNAFYVRFGYGFVGGDLKSFNLINRDAQFELGSLFYINALNLPEKLKLGIDATYISLSGFAEKDSLMKNHKSVSYLTAGAKLGPCLSYNFAGKWIADLYFKIHPNGFSPVQQDNTYRAPIQFKMGTSFGLNIRWKALMLGTEFTSTKYDFKIFSPVSKALNSSTPTTIKLPAANLSLGVNF